MNEIERQLLTIIAKGHPERRVAVPMGGKMVQTAYAKWDEIQVAMGMTISQLHNPIAHLVAEGYIDNAMEKPSGLGRFLGKQGATIFWATEEGRLASVGPTARALTEVETERALEMAVAACKQLGYNTTPYGVGVCLLSIESGYSPFETASQIALGTLARDVRASGMNILRLMAFLPHARAIIESLHEYTDRGLMRNTLNENDTRAIMGVVTVSPDQNEWIDKVLADPIISQERLAASTVDYDSIFSEIGGEQS